MIVLGVDPGTIRTGWGVVRRAGGEVVGHVSIVGSGGAGASRSSYQ